DVRGGHARSRELGFEPRSESPAKGFEDRRLRPLGHPPELGSLAINMQAAGPAVRLRGPLGWVHRRDMDSPRGSILSSERRSGRRTASAMPGPVGGGRGDDAQPPMVAGSFGTSLRLTVR